MAEVNGWIGIVPGPYDDDARLLSVTQGGRQALSFSMDIHGREYFTYARDGRMIVSFEPNSPDRRFGDDPHALDHLMDGLRFGITDDDVDPALTHPRPRHAFVPRRLNFLTDRGYTWSPFSTMRFTPGWGRRGGGVPRRSGRCSKCHHSLS